MPIADEPSGASQPMFQSESDMSNRTGTRPTCCRYTSLHFVSITVSEPNNGRSFANVSFGPR
ncbi:hypothetical protein D3C72_865890 [compost metagenome]